MMLARLSEIVFPTVRTPRRRTRSFGGVGRFSLNRVIGRRSSRVRPGWSPNSRAERAASSVIAVRRCEVNCVAVAAGAGRGRTTRPCLGCRIAGWSPSGWLMRRRWRGLVRWGCPGGEYWVRAGAVGAGVGDDDRQCCTPDGGPQGAGGRRSRTLSGIAWAPVSSSICWGGSSWTVFHRPNMYGDDCYPATNYPLVRLRSAW